MVMVNLKIQRKRVTLLRHLNTLRVLMWRALKAPLREQLAMRAPLRQQMALQNVYRLFQRLFA